MTADHAILTLLNQQQQHLEVLLSLLRQELAALAKRDVDTLTQLNSAKTDTLHLLQQTDSELALLPQLEQCKQQEWFKQQIALLDQLLVQCKRHNDVNQQTLEQSQLTLARFKTELLSSRGKAGLTYTNKGKPAIDNKGKGIKA